MKNTTIRILVLALINAGLVAIISQTLLIRELVNVFGGSGFSLGVIFSSWLFWVAMGSWFLGRFTYRIKDKPRLFVFNQILVCLFLTLAILIIRSFKFFLHIPPGEIIGLAPLVYFTFIILFPLSIVVGFQFSLGCQLYSELTHSASRASGTVYIYDALGNILGGIFFGYVLVNYFTTVQNVFLLITLNLILGLFLLVAYKKETSLTFGINIVLLIGVLSLVFAGQIMRVDSFSQKINWQEMNLEETLSTKYADYAVTKEGDLNSFYANGRWQFAYPDKLNAEEVVHFAMLQAPSPRQILVIGGAASGQLQELVKYPGARIFYTELDGRFLNWLAKYISESDKKLLNDSRIKIENIDGRLLVKKWRGNKFDVVIINISSPLTLEANRFYTLEFFNEVANLLNENGVIFFGIPSNENYLSPAMKNFNSGIYFTLKKVFPYVVLIPGETLFFTASRQGDYLTSDSAILWSRLQERKIKTFFVNEFTLPHRFYKERLKYILSIFADTKQAPLNLDFRPISYYYNLILWESQFNTKWTKSFLKAGALSWDKILNALFLLGLLILFILKNKFKKFFVPLAVLSAGFGGLALELILILGFQVLIGYIYHLIGIVVASFMLGLVLGAGYINRRLERIEDRILFLALWQIGFGIYAILLPLFLFILSIPGLKIVMSNLAQVAIPFLTIICGFFVGVVFPVANKIYLARSEEIGKTAGFLYGFDLIGACIGSLAVSLFLVPLFGLNGACLVIAGILGSSGFLVLFNK